MRPASPGKLLAQAETSNLLVSNLVNIEYLTGVRMSAGLLLVSPRSMTLFADGRYLEGAERLVRPGVTVRSTTTLEKTIGGLRMCGFEEEDVTYGRLRRWKRKFSSTKFVQTEGVVEHFRRSKDEEELRALQRARRVTQELLRRVPAVLRTGVTERAIAWKLEVWARELGAEELSFKPIVAFGTHTSRPHHQPTSRALRRGHVVQVDVGAKVRGYCGDLSEVFFTSKPSPLEQKVYDAVREAKERGEAAIKAGVLSSVPDAAARASLRKAGFEEYFCHSLGHGVGLEVHEGVTLSSQRKGIELLKNEVVTVEPGVYLPGKFGIRLEDMVTVD